LPIYCPNAHILPQIRNFFLYSHMGIVCQNRAKYGHLGIIGARFGH